MTQPLMLDATAITRFLSCRELYRLYHIENLQASKPSLHRAYGIAIHLAVETFWHGQPFEAALKIAAGELEKFPENLLNPHEQERIRDLATALPDMIAAYYDGVEYDSQRILITCNVCHQLLNQCICGAIGSSKFIELEWSLELTNVNLCGRIDRCEVGPILYDLKTASEIGKTWKADFRSQMLRDFGLGLYDWYLCQIGHAPKTVKVEVLVKPYRDKKPRLEIFDLPEITVYRKRFEQQLKWVVSEIVHYHESYLSQKPWPMSTTHCTQGKYGHCEMLEGCLNGWTPKTLDKFETRIEHLNVRRESAAQPFPSPKPPLGADQRAGSAP